VAEKVLCLGLAKTLAQLQLHALNIISWNLLHGGGKRIAEIVDTIAAENPDILCLQEFRHGRNKAPLLSGLTGIGLNEQVCPEPDSPRTNSLLVASRYPLQIHPPHSDHYQHLLPCRIELPDYQSIDLLCLHLPHKKRQIPCFQSLLELPSQWLKGASVLMGDINCGIPFEDSETRSFYASHLFTQLLQQGWIDAWRQRNKNAREFSWYSNNKGNGFRYDNALLSAELNSSVSAIDYEHSVREAGLSDHSMLRLQLAFDTTLET